MQRIKTIMHEFFGTPLVAVREFAQMLLGCMIIGIAIFTFYTQANLQVGGFSGLSLVICRLLHTDVSVGQISIILNIPVLVAIGFFISHKMLVRTLIGMLTLGYALDAAHYVSTYISAWLFPNGVEALEYILVAIFGGALFGLGCGLVVRSGYASGGSDNVAFLLRLIFKSLKFSVIIWLFDAAVILSGAYFNDGAESASGIIMYSIVALLTDVKVLDLVLSGYSYKRVVYIISKKNKEIADNIMFKMNRGVTGLKAVGGYSQEEAEVLLAVLDSKQVPRLKEVILAIDDKAFVFVMDSREVIGEGFIKTYF